MTARRARTVVVVAIVMFATACTSGSRTSGRGASATTTPQPAATFAVIGTSASVGDALQLPLQYAWPRLVFREAFPRATVFVNASVSGSSALDALHDQAPLIEQLHPTVIVIWLGAVEASQLVPPPQFATNLRPVVQGARSTGARVLLADLPPYPKTDVRPYNAVIDAIARDTGVTLVPLHSLDVPWFINEPLFLPTVEGHRIIATAIEGALQSKT
jgi:acyl-CoA thioesterase I